ncbi:DUF2141 domain-containing protein [Phenylobacterium sp.]|jgi:uncharacterized protein (DUF2141 family)|uniref:DUF2141 domain-containing protein n=1 Tax=Phenylobacterium sp. TaxID=1871053 RepID=UPI002E31C588|nr:DUF2141 domain-containing protein [Phenylobacterium sp.]HEX4709104.1 DUF2141 domain-containing protein [Phenylobacterium sp.]
MDGRAPATRVLPAFASWTDALIATLAFIAMPWPAQAAGAPITVTIWSLRIPGGSVRVDVCTRETFLHSNCPYSGTAPAQVGETTVTIADVPPGVYAVQAYHDIKDIGRLDQGPFGVPREGLAFSNDAPIGLRGPNFDRAAFTHGEDPQTLRLRLHHFTRAPPKSG